MTKNLRVREKADDFRVRAPGIVTESSQSRAKLTGEQGMRHK